MEMGFELSFCQLRTKEVVNSVDGKRMGRIIDIVFSSDRKLLGIVVPQCKQSFIFRSVEQIFIPWRCVKKIGADVILVNLCMDEKGNFVSPPKEPYDKCFDPHQKPPPPPPAYNGPPNCDRRCEKCMLFDCQFRWKNPDGKSPK